MRNRSEKSSILYYILYVIFRRKITIVIMSIIFFVFIIFFTFLSTPIFKSTTKIFIRLNPQQQLILFRDLAVPDMQPSKVNPANNLVQILTSRELATEVVNTFSLDKRLQKKSEEPEKLNDIIKMYLRAVIISPITLAKKIGLLEDIPTNYLEDAVENFIEDAQDIELEEDTNVINLSIWEESPSLSSNIANYMARRLIEKTILLEQNNAETAYSFTYQELNGSEKELVRTEVELQKFRKKYNIISFEEQKKAKLDELNKIESEFGDVQSNLSEAQARLSEMRRRLASQKELLQKSLVLTNNPVIIGLISSLNNDEIQLAGSLEKYNESSMQVQAARAQVLETKNKIAKELEAILQSDSSILQTVHPDLANEYVKVNAEVAALKARKAMLQKQMTTLRSEATTLSIIETEYDRLNRNRETSEKLYTNLLDKYSELEVQKSSHLSGYDLKIIDKAYLPDDTKPDWPKWILVLPLGLIASMFLSFFTAFFIEYWDESFKSPAEIEEKLGLPVLCTVPEVE